MEIEVSKCPYYNCFCYETSQLCKDVDNKFCTYKQLQQYKQLCEQKTVDNFDLMRQIDELKADKKKLEQFLENILEMAKYNYKNTCLATLYTCERCVENDKCGKQNPFTRLDFIREMIEEFKI